MCVCVLLKCMELCTHSAEPELFRPACDSSNTHMPTATAIKDSLRLCKIVKNGVQHVGHGIKDPPFFCDEVFDLKDKMQAVITFAIPARIRILWRRPRDALNVYSTGNESKEKFDFAALK